MWSAPESLAVALQGTHHVLTDASAWYDGRCTVPDLELIDGTITEEYDGDFVRSTLSATVADPDGTLSPRRPTDPLSPYGQEIRIREGVGAAPQWDWVPSGAFRIDDPQPSGGWIPYRPAGDAVAEWLRAPGVVPIKGSDRFGLVMQDQLDGLMQPVANSRLYAEVVRLVRGMLPVDVSTFPQDAIVTSGRVVYGDKPSDAIRDLLRLMGLVARVSRTGALEAVTPAIGEPVARCVSLVNLGATSFAPTRAGIRNAVYTVGDTPSDQSAPPRGYAQESSGPFRADGPLGRIPLRQASPFFRSDHEATRGAETRLATEIATRQIPVKVELAYDPRLQVLDTLEVEIRPDSRRPGVVRGLLTQLTRSLRGGTMSGTVMCSRSEVEAHA